MTLDAFGEAFLQRFILEWIDLRWIGGDIEKLMSAEIAGFVRQCRRNAAARWNLIKGHVVGVAEVAAHLDAIVILTRIPAIEPANRHGGVRVKRSGIGVY